MGFGTHNKLDIQYVFVDVLAPRGDGKRDSAVDVYVARERCWAHAFQRIVALNLRELHHAEVGISHQVAPQLPVESVRDDGMEESRIAPHEHVLGVGGHAGHGCSFREPAALVHCLKQGNGVLYRRIVPAAGSQEERLLFFQSRRLVGQIAEGPEHSPFLAAKGHTLLATCLHGLAGLVEFAPRCWRTLRIKASFFKDLLVVVQHMALGGVRQPIDVLAAVEVLAESHGAT